jgi:hypothetical protein
MLFVFLHLLVLIASSAMALSPRDAIHLDDIDRYDSFMKELDSATDHFLDMYMKNSMITVDVLHYPTNVIARSEQFTPSSVAQEYFDQEKRMAEEILGADSKDDGNSLESRQCGSGPGPHPWKRSDDFHNVKRRSNCFQFCGTIANCRGNNGCPHCYAVRQGCLWQKWCR